MDEERFASLGEGREAATVEAGGPGDATMKSLRSIPSVEILMRALGDVDLPRPVVLAVVRRQLAALRRAGAAPGSDAVLTRIREALDRLNRSRLRPVINGTGVLLHTNLGRAPLGPGVVRALEQIGSHYCNLEMDLETGERGVRAPYVEHNLAILCGAEATLAVNNCAAALVLMVRHFTAAARKEVVISRGELIQIGGGFRIPEILEASGARLREVGTTNRTTAADYARALGPATAMILKVHRSNFFMDGFVESPQTEELSALARRRRVVLVEDLGSGAGSPVETWGAPEHEPTPAEVLKAGVDLVCFSGDKLLGGPQAGIIAGSARLVGALRREPLFRALRCDKLILAALQATVDAHLHGLAPTDDLTDDLPVRALLRLTPDSLAERARKLVALLEDVRAQTRVGSGMSRLGGGTLPRARIASVTLEVRPLDLSLQVLADRLRRGAPPVVGYTAGGWYKLDLRTVFPGQDAALAGAIRSALG